jgi:hypothetical protein
LNDNKNIASRTGRLLRTIHKCDTTDMEHGKKQAPSTSCIIYQNHNSFRDLLFVLSTGLINMNTIFMASAWQKSNQVKLKELLLRSQSYITRGQ